MNEEQAPIFHNLKEIKREFPVRSFQFRLEGFFNWCGLDARDAGEKLIHVINSGQWPSIGSYLSIELVKELKTISPDERP